MFHLYRGGQFSDGGEETGVPRENHGSSTSKQTIFLKLGSVPIGIHCEPFDHLKLGWSK